MTVDRRHILTGGLGIGALAAGPRTATAEPSRPYAGQYRVAALDISADDKADQSKVLQRAIDAAAAADDVLDLPAGRYGFSTLALRPGTIIRGIPGRSVLVYRGEGGGISADSAANLRLDGLVLDGNEKPLGGKRGSKALLAIRNAVGIAITDCDITGSSANGLSLKASSGQIRGSRFTKIAGTALFSEDAIGLSITDNTISDCGNNGVQIWRSNAGEDGTIVAHNHIERIRSDAGGSGQNGNGINVFRAHGVQVTGNRISDCAFSAIRGNAASNAQFVANSCARLAEVAIYAEFGFEGSIVANNLIDGALTGISITNFNEGGRLAVAQGNLVRNLALDSKKGHGIGIGVEADTIVTGNVVENAPGVGIQLGWGRFLRDVTATGNIVRKARIGIGISADPKAGYVLVTNNMITGAEAGAIRAMDHRKALGLDLTRESAESYRNMAILNNVGL